MTYIIFLDGFDTEGWRHIESLFLPSFKVDEIVLYPAEHKERAIEMQDLLDATQEHTFLFFSVQHERPHTQDGSNIRKYRYKHLIEKIDEEFSFTRPYERMLCVIDRIPKIQATGYYVDEDKEFAMQLDRYGYVENNTDHPYFFSKFDMEILSQELSEAFLLHSDVRTKVPEIVKKHIEAKKVHVEEGHPGSVYMERLQIVEEKFLKEFTLLSLEEIEFPDKLLKNSLYQIFSSVIGVGDTVKSMTLLTYRPPTKHHEEVETNITIASLMSLLSNRERKEFKKGWLEAEIDIDREYLQRSLQRLASLEMPHQPIQNIHVSVHDIKNMLVGDKTKALEQVEFDAAIPFFYSSNQEDKIVEQMERMYADLEKQIVQTEERLIAERNRIYSHPETLTEETLSIEDLENKANAPILSDYSSVESIEDMKTQLKRIPVFKYIEKLRMKFRKLMLLPQVIVTFLLFTIIMVLPSVASYIEHTRYIASLTNIVLPLVLFSLFAVSILYFRSGIRKLLLAYEKELHHFQELLEHCYKNCLDRYSKTFKNKLLFENREKYRAKLREVEAEERMRSYHYSRVESLNQEARLIADLLEMKLEYVDTFIPADTYKKDVDQVMEYALFNEKYEIKDIIINVKKHLSNIEIYGNIDHMVIHEIEVGEK